MRDADAACLLFALLTLWIGWQAWSGVRDRMFVSLYGVVITPETAPKRYWFLVGFLVFMTGLAALATAAVSVAPVRGPYLFGP